MNTNKIFQLSAILWMAASALLQAQVTISQAVPILEGIQNGTIQATVEPPFTSNTVDKVFDGNPLTSAVLQNGTALTITLAFQDSVQFNQSKVYFWNSGTWSLESALTLDDLNNGTGSYQLMVNSRPYNGFAWDSLAFGNVTALFVRLKAENPQGGILVGEWVLQANLIITSLNIYPYPPKVLPNTALQLKAQMVDQFNRLMPYTLGEPLVWSSDDLNIATVDEFGLLTGVALGNTTVRVRTASNSLFGSAPVSVVNDFQSSPAQPLLARVALVIQDPVIDSTNNRRIHQVWNWSDPYLLINQILDDFVMASNGVVQYQIVETHDDGMIFTTIDSTFMSIDTLQYFFLTPGQLYGRNTPGTLQNLAEVQGRVHFNYNAMVDYYDLDTKRNNGQIHEVWVYSFPFSGMYESQLMGPGAFWYNSPPLAHPGLERLLPVMGWNYERGVAEALHSYGHRVESAMWYLYGRWDVFNPDPNPWELFTRIDKDLPGKAHVGNVHFPPNGQSDYDYANNRVVVSYADNWKRYPYLLNQTRSFNCGEWNCDQRDYMRWWLGHLPRYEGVYEGVLNNWWHYVVDYEEAVEIANSLSVTAISPQEGVLPERFQLFQNYPNPFNAKTVIPFTLTPGGAVRLRVFDILGKEVATLLSGRLPAGSYRIPFDGTSLASGIYLYRLEANGRHWSRKMLLVK